MYRFLPILIGLLSLVALFWIEGSVYAQTETSSGLTAGQAQNIDDRWIIDPEVTAIGKNASRAGLLLDWALRDYNWSYTTPGTTNPLLPFWATLRNFVYSFMIVVVVAAAIVMLVTRGRSLTIRRFIPRFIIVSILVTFSFSIVQVLYELVDIFQGFFVRPNGVPISQRDLLSIGWNYDPFVGLRLLGDANFEAAFTTLIFVKLTTFTYYVMVGILLIRKVILWFFIIISPFFPLLLFFYPLRNTAKIWVGEFFRWLLYAPLFAIFLAALVSLWRTGIPLSFNFGAAGAASAIIFPTAVSILLGGPGQAVGQLNNLNVVDTYAQYLVAIMMLWGVIIVPWILLQIFLDYLSNVNVQNAPFYKQFSRYLNKSPIAPSPSSPPQSPTPPPGGGGAGRGRTIPLIKDFKIPSMAGLAKPIPRGSAVNVSQMTKLSVPTMRDIAKMESASIQNSEKTREESQKVRETLKNIANPQQIRTEKERSEYEKMRETLQNQSLKGDKIASSILSAANTYSQSSQTTQNTTENVTNIVNQLANPQSITDSKEREQIQVVKEKIRTESQRNNPFAKKLSQVTNTTQNITNVLNNLAHNTQETNVLRERIEKESEKGNSLATTLMSTVSSITNRERATQALMNIHAPSQVADIGARQQFINLQESIRTEKEKGSEFATHLTEKLDRLSKETNTDEKEKLTEEIRESVTRENESGNPLAALLLGQISQLRDKKADTSLSDLNTELKKAQQQGNPLATELMSLAEKENLSEAEAQDLEEKVDKAKQNGDPLGVLLSDLLMRRKKALETEKSSTTLPTQNRIQQVSLDDYEAVKKMWTESYENLDVPGVENATQRTAWIKDDISQISQTIDLLSSQDSQKIKEGMDKVSDILPFLLIGGFSQGEIVAYLKAKQEAAKSVLSQVEKVQEEEDTQVLVEKKKTSEPRKMSAEISAQPPQPVERTNTSSNVQHVQTSTQMQDSRQTSTSLLKLANITIPDMKSLTQYDKLLLSKKDEQSEDVRLMRETLRGVANPKAEPDLKKREYYSSIREKLLNESKGGDAVSSSVLTAGEEVASEKMRKTLVRFAKLSSLLTALQKGDVSESSSTEKHDALKNRISYEVSRGNDLAGNLEKALRETSVLNDPLQKTTLLSDIENASKHEDTLAQEIVALSSHRSQDVYAGSLLNIYSFLRTMIDVSHAREEERRVVEAIQKNLSSGAGTDETMAKLNQMIEKVRKDGIDLQTVVQTEAICTKNKKALLQRVPELSVYLKEDESLKPDLKTAVSAVAGVGTQTNDLFASKLSAWKNGFPQNSFESLQKLLEAVSNTGSPNDPEISSLVDELEKNQTKNDVAASLLSFAKSYKSGTFSREDLVRLLPTLIETLVKEARSGNQLALHVQRVLTGLQEEKVKIGIFRTLLSSLSDPTLLSTDKKDQIMSLRTLVISENEKGNPFAQKITDCVSKLVRKDPDTNGEVLTALYTELLTQKENGNQLATALFSEVETQRQSEKLMDLGEILKHLSQPDTVPESEKQSFISVRSELERLSQNGDADAMSVLSAIDIIKEKGVDLGEVRKVSDLMESHSSSVYSQMLSDLCTSSLLSYSTLSVMIEILEKLGRKEQSVISLSDILTSTQDELSSQILASSRNVLQTQSYEAKLKTARTLMERIFVENQSVVSKEVISFLKKKKIQQKTDTLFTILEHMASPDTIQLPEEKETAEKLSKQLNDSAHTDSFGRLVKGVISVLQNQNDSQNNTSLLPLLSAYISTQAETGDEIASHILTQTSHGKEISDAEMLDEIEKEAEKGNPVAQKIQSLLSGKKASQKTVVLPKENTVQNISIEDYESVKRMWIDGYKTLEVPGSTRTREQWLSDESQVISETISLLVSVNEEDNQRGLEKVSSILPILLIGGFSHGEVTSYLKAKLEAARTVLNMLKDQQEENDTKLENKPVQHEAEKSKEQPME